MWGRFWNNLYNDVVPYPDRPNLDVSEQMKLQGYNVKKMFESAIDKTKEDIVQRNIKTRLHASKTSNNAPSSENKALISSQMLSQASTIGGSQEM